LVSRQDGDFVDAFSDYVLSPGIFRTHHISGQATHGFLSLAVLSVSLHRAHFVDAFSDHPLSQSIFRTSHSSDQATPWHLSLAVLFLSLI
jgi:hypothetical protein